MSLTGRAHEHQCPRCKQKTVCANSQCYRTNYAHTRLCHGSYCAQEKQALYKPVAVKEPELFTEKRDEMP